MTDFGPLLANPKSFLLGAAAQLGIFATFLGALALGFTYAEAGSIGIIGGADGPTAIYLTSKLAPGLLGPIDRGSRLFIHGFGSCDTATYHESVNNPERTGDCDETIA